MLIKVLGIIDIIAGLILIFEKNINPSIYVLMILGLILISKSFLGLPKDFASWIDLSSGLIFLLLIIISIPWIISLIFGLLILQKGIFSFL